MRKAWLALVALLGVFSVGLMGCGDGSQQDEAMEAQRKADAEAKEKGIDAGY